MFVKIINLAAATAVFVGAHFVMSSSRLRAPLRARFGELGFLGIYTLVALSAFAWMIVAYAARPHVVLWNASPGLFYVPLLVMPFALYLIVGGYLVPNPMKLGEIRAFDDPEPVRGVVKITRHPAMWGIALWAISHMLCNGDLASQILFGGMLVLALGGARHIDHRRRHEYPERFARYAALTSFVPFGAMASGRAAFTSADIRWLPAGLALAGYIGLLALHQTLIGAAPWPR